MACLHGTYQWFMNRIRNAKIRIIALFCCALWASGVLTGILVRTSLPKAIPKSIPKPNPICGYKNPTIIPKDRIGIQKEFIIKKRRYGQYKRLMEGQLIAREDYLQAT